MTRCVLRNTLKASFWTICAVFQRDVGLSKQDEHQTRGVGQSYCSHSHCAGTRVAGRIQPAIMCVHRHHSHGSILIGLSHQPHEESKLLCMAPRTPQPLHQNLRPKYSSSIYCVRRKRRSPSSSRMTVLEQSSNGVHPRGVISVQIRPLGVTARVQKRRRRQWAVGLDGSSFCLFSPLYSRTMDS